METEYNLNQKKFPKSITGRQCIGPCYESNKYIMHPINLTYVTDKEKPFCPTHEWRNEKTGKNEIIDICLIPSKADDINKQQIELNFIVPTFEFSCEYFLKTFYNIYSFESALDWISTNINNPIYSLLRIINCAWKIYGSTVDIINEQLIEFYINVIKKEWIKDIYPIISKYLSTENKRIYMKRPNKNDINNKNINQIEKINFIMKKFITNQAIYKVLHNYIESNKDDWDNIKSHNEMIEEYLIKYIVEKIESTI